MVPMVRRVAGCLVLGTFWAFLGVAFAQESILMESAQGRITLKTARIEGELYVPLVPLVERAGLDFQWDPILQRLVLLRAGSEQVVALVDVPIYKVRGEIVQARLPLRFHEGSLYLPVEVLRTVLREALEINFPATPVPTRTSPPTATPIATPTPPVILAEVYPTLPLPLAVPEELYATPMSFAEPLPLETPGTRPRVVVLDPARGGPDPGVISADGLREADLVFDLAVLLKRHLEESLGVQVVLTRPQAPDRGVSAEERAIRANSADGDILVSLHLGGGLSELSEGFSVFYMTDVADDRQPYRFDSQRRLQGDWPLAAQYDWETAYLPHMMESERLAKLVRKYLDREVQAPDRGLRPARLALLRSVQMPAVWVELGVLSNPREAQLLRNEDYQQRLIGALYLALREFIEGVPG